MLYQLIPPPTHTHTTPKLYMYVVLWYQTGGISYQCDISLITIKWISYPLSTGRLLLDMTFEMCWKGPWTKYIIPPRKCHRVGYYRNSQWNIRSHINWKVVLFNFVLLEWSFKWKIEIMKNGESPGSDGYTPEFLNRIWSIVVLLYV